MLPHRRAEPRLASSARTTAVADRVDTDLTLAYDRAPRHPLPDQLVILSDLHRGIRDPADDFQSCEPAYSGALTHYRENGWHLALLGDTLELWENYPAPVLRAYLNVNLIEADFRASKRLWEFYGNHDAELADESRVHEAVRFERAGRTIFLVHGHQGTDSHPRLSAWFVRNVWRRIQREANVGVRPSQDYGLRSRTNRNLYDWALGRDEVLLIAGHTHEPVFGTSEPTPPPDPETARNSVERAVLEAQHRIYRRPFKAERFVYANTGCCCYDDGDITGIEISVPDDEIRLVKWNPDGDRRVLASANVSDVLTGIGASGSR
jgi:predicted phosphodiesterase